MAAAAEAECRPRHAGGAGVAQRRRAHAGARARGAPIRVPAYPVKVKDASGAGDTVVAALAVMLAARADFEVAMRAANAARRDRGRQARHRDGVGRRTAPPHPAGRRRSRSEDKIVFDRAMLDERLAEWRRRACASASPMAASIFLHRGPHQAAGRGARGLRPAGGRPQQRCLGDAPQGRGAADPGRRLARRRAWPRSKRSISSWCSRKTRRSS